MEDWNVVVCVHPRAFTVARRRLREFGAVDRTPFYNVLVMRVADPREFLGDLAALMRTDPGLARIVSRAVPVSEGFRFASAAEFDARARAVALSWLPQLAGKSFHARIHRRGERDILSCRDEEQALDRAVVEALGQAGTPGRVSFEDPDAIIDIETVGDRAGMALWTREQRAQAPFLRLD